MQQSITEQAKMEKNNTETDIEPGAIGAMTFHYPGSEDWHEGTCVQIRGDSIVFQTKNELEANKALEILIQADDKNSPPLNAFVEVKKVTKLGREGYSAKASIEGIKGH